MNRQGFTLMELAVASTLALIVILAIGQVDTARLYLSNQTRAEMQSEAPFAIAHMTQQLSQADWINRVDGSHLQFRVPLDPLNLDAAAGYRWAQYNLGSNEILFYDDVRNAADCNTVDARFFGINTVNVSYQDASPTPPGGEPPQQDNNMLKITLTSGGYTYTGQVAIRAGAYTNVMSGLAPAGVSNPSACP